MVYATTPSPHHFLFHLLIEGQAVELSIFEKIPSLHFLFTSLSALRCSILPTENRCSQRSDPPCAHTFRPLPCFKACVEKSIASVLVLTLIGQVPVL